MKVMAMPATSRPRPARLGRGLVYGLLLLNVVIFSAWWWHVSGATATSTTQRLTALGRWTGLVAEFGALLELILVARLPRLERWFGLERLVRLHRWNGYVVFWGIMLHVVFLVYGYRLGGHPGVVRQFIDFLSFPDMVKALFGTLMFMAVTITSIVLVRRRLRHEMWYMVHIMAYAAIILAFFHQLSTGGDFVGHPWFRDLWVGELILALAVVLVYRIANPWLGWMVHRLRVDRVVRESPQIYSLYVTGRQLDRLEAVAGQFFGVRVLAPGLWWQEHPFSLSHSPNNQFVRLSFRVLGDYTQILPGVVSGAPVLLDGPRGNFTWEQVSQPQVLFIAGGVGITPLLSLLQAAPPNIDIVLIYAVRSQADAAFTQELAAALPRAIVRLVYEDVQGRLTEPMLRQLCPDVAKREVFLCGPGGMMAALHGFLLAAGVDESLIHSERFEY